MQFLKSFLVMTSSAALLFLGACSGSNQPTTTASTENSSVASTPAETKPSISPSTTATTAKKGDHSHSKQEGQVVESGPYHLELVTGSEAAGTHIDFFLQKGDNHQSISNAKVTAQVQLPDGSQKSLPMKYNAGDKHYTAILPGSAAGEYKVAILSDINGEKINGRFSFTQ